MERGERFAPIEAAAQGESESAPHVCKCGRAPWRPGQRNCVYCNREANRKYRESLKRQAARLLEIGDRIGTAEPSGRHARPGRAQPD